jgi:hypothetical protein
MGTMSRGASAHECGDGKYRADERGTSAGPARGHDVTAAPGWSLGRLVAAGREASGALVAAADPRGMTRYAVGR